MKRLIAVVLLSIGFAAGGVAAGTVAQSTVGTLTGIVTDATKAALPGVAVRVLNEDTGQSQTMLTNDSGAYSFVLAPGNNYTLTAELAGFKKAAFNRVTLRMADTQRVDIALEVGGLDVSIIVDVEKTNPLMKDPNIGITLDETQIMGLPMVGNDPLALIAMLPGYRANPLGHEYDTVGGLPMYMMNTVRDGLSVTDGFNAGGVGSNTILNPDMISEIRLILAPVDAEAGRGNGQIQITTKSGTNKFQWNINYNIRQNALNALGPDAANRLASVYGPNTRKPPFGATFQYTVSVSGPIWKNHTFYFVNWDHQMRWERASPGVQTINGTTLTGFSGSGGYLSTPALSDLARNGVYRYFDGWVSAPQNESIPTAFSNTGSGTPGSPGRWPTQYDAAGAPIAPQFWSDNTTPFKTPYTGALRCFSVFGNIKFDGSPFDPAVDCGTYIPRYDDGLGNGIESWVPDFAHPVYGLGALPDSARHPNVLDPSAPDGVRVTWEQANRLFDRPPDRTGYVQRLLSFMPRVNNYLSVSGLGGQLIGATSVNATDTLNKGSHAWVRGTNGRDNRNTFRGGTFGFGTSLDQSLTNHKIVNLKIDHNIASHSRVSVSTSFQNDLNSRVYFQSRWPEGADGYAARRPRVVTVNGISTLSSNMVNEARFGLNFNRSMQLAPWDNVDQTKADFARSFLTQGWEDPNNHETTPIYFLPGASSVNASNVVYYNFQDNILPYGLSGANSGLSALNGRTAAGPLSAGGTCTPTTFGGSGGDNGTELSSINCETGSVLYNFADTFSWNHGSHQVRAGAELRLTRASELSGQSIPQAQGGVSTGTQSDLSIACTSTTTCATTGVPELPGFQTGQHGGRLQVVAEQSADLLYLLSGSVGSVAQSFWVNTLDNYRYGTWETWSVGNGQKIRKTIQNEYAVFLKDDWKIGKRLTLNLGVRYENYGNAFLEGFATGIVDQGYGLFGPSRARGANPLDYWLTPGNLYYTGYGRTAPPLDVRGTFLPNGQPNYIPGNCDVGTVIAGSNTAAGTVNTGIGANQTCITAGGIGVQVVPSSITVSGTTSNLITAAVNCVYGVQQSSLLPVSNCDPSLLTSRVFVGPGSDHPDQPVLYRDRNNIGPAIGFSYRMPLGARTVLIRGGFQFTYGSAGRDRSVGSGSAGQATQQTGGGATAALDQMTSSCSSASTCLGPSYTDSSHALTLADLPNIVPLQTQLYNNPQYVRPAIGASGGSAGAGLAALQGSKIVLVQNWGVGRTLSATAYAPGYQDPRTENYTFSVSTNLTKTSTLALSYVGTLGRNRPTGVNLNTPNVYHNPELLDALARTRAGEDVPLFDQMFAGWNLTQFGSAQGWGPVGTCVSVAGGLGKVDPANNINCGAGTVYQSGSAHLRNANPAALGTGGYVSLAADLANGNFLAVANVLASSTPTLSGGVASTGNRNQDATISGALSGALLRNGCDRLGSATTANPLDRISGSATLTSGNTGIVRCFPEDYLISNPGLQVGNGAVNPGTTGGLGRGVVYKDTWGYTNYHQFQTQYTLRLAAGVNLQATYLTSKTLALPRDFYKTNTLSSNPLGGLALGSLTGFSDPQNEETRRRDYGEASDSLKHVVRVNGVFQLPFGPGKPLLSKAPRWLTQILGGWQMGVIYNGQSGQPFSIVAGDMQFGQSTNSTTSASDCGAYKGTLTAVTTGTPNVYCVSGLGMPDVVSPLWNNPRGQVRKNGADGNSTYFGNPSPFAIVDDPQCLNGTVSLATDRANVTPLSSRCSLKALALKVNPGTPGAIPLSSLDSTPVVILLQNPLPGHQGTLGAQTMRQPSRTYLDANLSKTFMFTETRGIQIRVDATNVLNRAAPSDMYLSLGPSSSTTSDILDGFTTSTAERSALASGCGGITANVQCGRQVQFGLRMIN